MIKKVSFLIMMFFLPLVFDPRLQDFVLAKVVFLEAFTLIIFFIWLLGALAKKELVWKASPIYGLIFLYIIFSLAAAFHSAHPPTSFFDSYIMHDGFFLNLNYLLIFFLALNFFPESDRPILGLTVWTAGVGVALYGLGELMHWPGLDWGLPSPWGIYSTVGFHNFSAAYLTMAFWLGQGLYFQYAGLPRRYCLLAGQIIIFAGLVFTESFSGWFGWLAGLASFIYFGRKLNVNSFKKIMLFLFPFLILLGLILPFQLKKMPLEREIFRLKIDGALRVETWKSALKMIGDHPFLGIGPDTFELIFPRYQTKKFAVLSGGKTITHSAHNEILDVAVSRGLPALAIYLGILYLLLKSGGGRIQSEKSWLLIGFWAAALSYLFQNLMSFGEVSITATFWMLAGVLVSSSGEIRISLKNFLKETSVIVISLALILYFLSGILIFLGREYVADRCFVDGQTAVGLNDFTMAVDLFSRARVFNPLRSEYSLYLGQLYLDLARRWPLESQKLIEEGLISARMAIQINDRQFAGYYLAGLLARQSKLAETKKLANGYFIEGLRLNPYRPELLAELYGIFPGQSGNNSPGAGR